MTEGITGMDGWCSGGQAGAGVRGHQARRYRQNGQAGRLAGEAGRHTPGRPQQGRQQGGKSRVQVGHCAPDQPTTTSTSPAPSARTWSLLLNTRTCWRARAAGRRRAATLHTASVATAPLPRRYAYAGSRQTRAHTQPTPQQPVPPAAQPDSRRHRQQATQRVAPHLLHKALHTSLDILLAHSTPPDVGSCGVVAKAQGLERRPHHVPAM